MNERKNGLTFGARYALFIVSYLPMFFIMIFRQLYVYNDFLKWGGLNKYALWIFIKYFGAVIVLLLASIFGVFGIVLLLNNMARKTHLNGDIVTVKDIENKNSETITYLFTYVIPFVFQDLSDPGSVVPVFILLLVTFFIYRNSTLILINPTISMWYSLYMVEYTEDNGSLPGLKKGMLITKEAFLEENDQLKIKKIGHKLFYAEPLNDE